MVFSSDTNNPKEANVLNRTMTVNDNDYTYNAVARISDIFINNSGLHSESTLFFIRNNRANLLARCRSGMQHATK